VAPISQSSFCLEHLQAYLPLYRVGVSHHEFVGFAEDLLLRMVQRPQLVNDSFVDSDLLNAELHNRVAL